MRRWQVQDAKARFSELLEASLKEGPQLVTRRGVEAAVLVPVQEWRRLQQSARPTLKALLLAETPRAELPVPPRGRLRRRAHAARG
jgi:antitoxin Phd